MAQTPAHFSPSPSGSDTSETPSVNPGDVLDFWLADGLTEGWPTTDLNKRWFLGGKALDAEIDSRFGAAVRQAMAGGLQSWEADLLPRLALIILLDQFTRNVLRGSGEAFAGDARAQQLVQRTLAAGDDVRLPWVGRVFLYMPLEHAEDLALQQQCVACFTRLLDEAPAALKKPLQGNLDFAKQHHDIIKRFGRFPHRNAAMGRTSTAEEETFLIEGPRFGQ